MTAPDDLPDPLQDRVAAELAAIRSDLEEIAASDTDLAADAARALDWLDEHGGDAGAA